MSDWLPTSSEVGELVDGLGWAESAESRSLAHFSQHLPKRPWCADLSGTRVVRPRRLAGRAAYVSPNGPHNFHCIALRFEDIDLADFMLEAEGLPPWSIQVTDRRAGTFTGIWELSRPVGTTSRHRSAPMTLALQVQASLVRRLGAELLQDLVPNPLRPDLHAVDESGPPVALRALLLRDEPDVVDDPESDLDCYRLTVQRDEAKRRAKSKAGRCSVAARNAQIDARLKRLLVEGGDLSISGIERRLKVSRATAYRRRDRLAELAGARVRETLR